MAKAEKEIPALAVQSKVKEYLAAQEVRTSGELVDSLNLKIAALLDSAVIRCKGNGRQTVKPEDL